MFKLGKAVEIGGRFPQSKDIADLIWGPGSLRRPDMIVGLEEFAACWLNVLI